MSYVNKSQALIGNMNQSLIDSSNDIGNSIIAQNDGNYFNCTFVIQRPIVEKNPLFPLELKDKFGQIISALGGRSFYFSEANSNRYQEESQIIFDTLDQVVLNLPTINPDDIAKLKSINESDFTEHQYISAEQFQANQRLGKYASVLVYLASDMVTALRVIRRGTGTLRGLTTLIYADEDSPTGTMPTLSRNLETNYNINIFLKSLQSALNSERQKKGE